MKSNVSIISGIVKDEIEQESITDFGKAGDTSSENRCCGPDCCDGNGIIRWRDQQAPHAKYVEYVKAGAKVFATEAAYEADKLAGFV